MVVLDVSEGIVHEAASTAMVAFLVRTVHKVLLGEAHQFVGAKEVLALEGAGLQESQCSVPQYIKPYTYR